MRNLLKVGAGERTRTFDILITNQFAFLSFSTSYSKIAKYIARFSLLTIQILALTFGAIFGTAKASDLRIGAGVNCGKPKGDGVWEQDGMVYDRKECGGSIAAQYLNDLPWKVGPVSFTYAIGFGYRKGPRIVDAEWVSDPCYERRQYSGGALNSSYGITTGECDLRWYSQEIDTTTKAYTLAFGPTWNLGKNTSISFKYGVSYFDSTMKIEWNNDKGVCSRSSCSTAYHREKGKSAYYEIGGSRGDLSATFYYAPSERSGEAASHGNYGLLLGYSINL